MGSPEAGVGKSAGTVEALNVNTEEIWEQEALTTF